MFEDVITNNQKEEKQVINNVNIFRCIKCGYSIEVNVANDAGYYCSICKQYLNQIPHLLVRQK